MAPADLPWLRQPGAPRLDSEVQVSSDRRRLELGVDADTPWVEGHFPERAVLPGIVLLRWAIDAARSIWPELEQVVAISNLKFQQPILPPAQLTLVLDRSLGEEQQRLNFVFSQDGQDCARGGVRFS